METALDIAGVPVRLLGRFFAPKPPARVLQLLRWRVLHNTLGQALTGSRLRLAFILFFGLFIWGLIFGISAEAFYFLKTKDIPLAGAIVGTLFDLLFVALTVLLIFSTGIILYSSLFSAAETSFLLTTPAPADQVFAYKFQGAIVFSSWAFVLLGSPLLVAYGLVFSVPWFYYALLPFFFLGFVLLPGGLGGLLCLLFVNYLPRKPKQVLAASSLALIAIIVYWFQSIRPSDWTQALNRDFIQRLVGQFAFAQGPLSPNHWLSQGIQAAARGDAVKLTYFLALIWSNGLLLYVIVMWISRHLYRRGFDRLAAGGSLRRRYGGQRIDYALDRLVGFLDPRTRLLIIKDFRTFRRDPAQWAQVLIFTGLMILYFTNLRRFYHEQLSESYQNGVSLMNLAATALLLCAYTGRFIFPMLSLEGRKFWILGLLPLERYRLLWGKFAFSATWSLLTAAFLVAFSDFMLGMPGYLIVVHLATVTVLALGLSGLSVGLGAVMPNFRESDPSKIAVGFGGTLNLIVSLLFLLAIIALMAAPWHLQTAPIQKRAWLEVLLAWWLPGGMIAGLVVGGAAVMLPLRWGARELVKSEF
jgi:ABC-2 type transport system permease protein